MKILNYNLYQSEKPRFFNIIFILYGKKKCMPAKGREMSEKSVNIDAHAYLHECACRIHAQGLKIAPHYAKIYSNSFMNSFCAVLIIHSIMCIIT